MQPISLPCDRHDILSTILFSETSDFKKKENIY